MMLTLWRQRVDLVDLVGGVVVSGLGAMPYPRKSAAIRGCSFAFAAFRGRDQFAGRLA